MEINFIITCFDRENYWNYIKNIISSYKNIKPNIVLCYNRSNDEFKNNAQVVLPNYGHQLGEMSMIISGVKFAKQKFKSKKFIKLSIDSWLLDENIIISIFENLKNTKTCYAGNFWNTNKEISTDIFFVDEEYGRLFDNFGLNEHEIDLVKKGFLIAENIMCRAVESCGAENKMILIKERHPVHPNNRFECMNLGWTMHHDLNLNIKNLENFNKKSK